MQSVPLLSKRRSRAQTMQKVQHLVPAVPLLLTGIDTLRQGAHGLELLLALCAIVTSVLLFGTVIREIRSRRSAAPSGHVPHGVDWFHLLASAVIVAEVFERWHRTHHWARPLLLTALVSLTLGLFHARIDGGIRRRRSLRLSDGGIYVSTRPFSAFRAAWADVASLEIGARRATIQTRTGTVRHIDLGDLHNADEVRGALEAARTRLSHENPNG